MKLIAFPFAGGNKYSYNFLVPYLKSEKIELKTLEYPGRGQRIKEPFLKNIDAIVTDAYKNLLKEIDHTPYIIYGHSMGGLIGYLVTQKIITQGVKKPFKLIVSGSSAPSMYMIKGTHKLKSNEFWKKITQFGGMPEEILKDQSITFFLEPILRADFQVIEEYTYKKKEHLTTPIDVFYGDQEVKETTEEFTKWEEETTENTQVFALKGNHFFIHDHAEYLANHFIQEFENHI